MRLLLVLWAFVALLGVVSVVWLIPALEARKAVRSAGMATTQSLRDIHLMSGVALLLVTLLLAALLIGLMLAMRGGRFFKPRDAAGQAPTPPFDAWSEAGKRLEIDESDEPK